MSNFGAYVIGSRNIVEWYGHRHRVFSARGPDVVTWAKDFADENVASADTPRDATVTLVEAGVGETTVTIPDSSQGTLLVTTDAAENDGANIQWTAEAFEFTTAQRLVYFGCRLQMNDVVQSDLLIGLCITDTDLLGGMTDGMYFRKVDGSAAVSGVAEKDSTETAAAATHTLVVNTYTVFEFLFRGDAATPEVSFYADGVLLGKVTTNLPDNELLRPSLHVLTGEANACTATIDWIKCIAIGRT